MNKKIDPKDVKAGSSAAEAPSAHDGGRSGPSRSADPAVRVAPPASAPSSDAARLAGPGNAPPKPFDWPAARDAAIGDFLERFAAECPDHDVLADLMVAITRLARDGTHRGDLKLLTNSFKELRYAFKVFTPYRALRKISVFGSARTPAGHPEFGQAVEFAGRMREGGWMIITGAGDGIMGAAQKGAGRAGSFGVAIRLPHEQKTNVVIADDPKLINFKYFFTRKILFLKEASAIALFPGGFGTQDEGFEAMTMIQTGKSNLIPLVMIDAPGGTYWQHWRTYIKAELLHNGMINAEDMNLFKITDDVGEAVEEVTGFYRRYHSMRYVGPRLMLRLSTPLTTEALERLNDTYAVALLTAGRIEQHTRPLEGEGEDVEFPELPRLTLAFNHRDVGLLRLMINDINHVAWLR
ncbi:MAG: LOG family protein [Candidatus Aminicenantes bacterium]|nr:LOG family protein [Candidatus Aminicenantes bacterium]